MTQALRSTLFAACALSILAGCSSNSLVASPGASGLQPASTVTSRSAVRQVSERFPVSGPSRELAAVRPVVSGAAPQIDKPTKKSRWTQLATIPGAVIHDISFPTLETGYAAAELGQVWKTTNGGKTWSEIMNLGFPYYWYGVTALSDQIVVISGFDDNNYEGIIRWSTDGGSTWTGDIVLTTTGWSDRIRFASQAIGLVVDQLNTQAANAVHYTTDGGAGASDWTELVPDPNGGWFGDQFTLLSDQNARMSGINYCASPNAGQTWTCGPSIDSVFDGPVYFANDNDGWVGGGEISPQVEGWLHVTTDGGQTWSGRTLTSPWPIREIMFVSPTMGWAAGGNIYSKVGGIYFSRDGGKKWHLDLDTNGVEVKACDKQPSGKKIQIWCAGFDDNLNGAVYTATVR